jgi:hypothetical protein
MRRRTAPIYRERLPAQTLAISREKHRFSRAARTKRMVQVMQLSRTRSYVARAVHEPSSQVAQERNAHRAQARAALCNRLHAARAIAARFSIDPRATRELILTKRAIARKISQNHVAQFFEIRTTTH